MNVQKPNETHPDRLQLSWVEVRDDPGRARMEARWNVVHPPVNGGAVQAA